VVGVNKYLRVFLFVLLTLAMVAIAVGCTSYSTPPAPAPVTSTQPSLPTPPTATPAPPTEPTTPPECANTKCYYKKSSLANSATYDIHPAEYLYLPTGKTLKAFVKGNANFDLYMYAHVNGNWNLVAKSDSDGGDETTSYEATGNYYYSWIVVLRSPNTTGGSYSIWITN
jgi:hypothetical protein